MTHDPLPATVQDALHAHLGHAREHAHALSPKIRPGTSLASALARVDTGASRPLPTVADLTRWHAQPAGLDDEQHARLCAGGLIEVMDEGGHTAAHACPRCQAGRRSDVLLGRLERSGIPPRYLELEWADLVTDLDPFPRLRAATGRMPQILAANDSLLLSGPPGAGKTQVAVLAAKAVLAAGHSALVVNLGRLALDVREGYGDSADGLTEGAALRLLTAPTLLILDDLGAGETDTAKVERRLLYLALEERQNARKPCVITTNLSPAELAAYLGARNLGRLQPLEIVELKHGRNFRLRDGHRSAW